MLSDGLGRTAMKWMKIPFFFLRSSWNIDVEIRGPKVLNPKMSPCVEDLRERKCCEVKGAENTKREPQQVQEELHVLLSKELHKNNFFFFTS